MRGSCKSRKYLKLFLRDCLASATARIASDAAMFYKTNKIATFYEVTKYTIFVCANYIENRQDGCSKKRFSAPKLLLGHPCIETTATHEGKTKCFTRPMSCRVMLTWEHTELQNKRVSINTYRWIQLRHMKNETKCFARSLSCRVVSAHSTTNKRVSINTYRYTHDCNTWREKQSASRDQCLAESCSRERTQNH